MASSTLTLRHINRIRLARDDLERMVSVLPDETFDETVKGCTVKVLLEEENQARVYRIAWITGVDSASTAYRFGTQLSTSKTLILDFSIFKMSYQMNTISNSEFSDVEFREWVRTCDNRLPFSAERAEEKANQLQLTWDQYPDAAPGRPTQTRRRPVASGSGSGPPGPNGAPTSTMLRPGRGAVRNPGDGEISTMTNELLESFLSDNPRLTQDQSQLVTSFARHCDAAIARERQKMLHTIKKGASSAAGAPAPATAAPSGAAPGADGSVVLPDLDMLDVDALKRLLSEVETKRKEVQDKIDEKGKCVVCFQHDARILLLPCKHQVRLVPRWWTFSSPTSPRLPLERS